MSMRLYTRSSRNKKSRQEQLHADWLAEKLSAYNYTHDAELEAMMNYPKRRLLYRKHVDIDKTYERTTKFYRICQTSCGNDRDRQIRDTEEKFTRLLEHTFRSTPTRTHSLVTSYHKWMARSSMDTEDFDRLFDSNMRALQSSNSVSKWFKQLQTPVSGARGASTRAGHFRRIPSPRSQSAAVPADGASTVKTPSKLQKAYTSLH